VDPNHERFDRYADHTYASEVESVIPFTHQGHEFFTQAKVNHLLSLVARRVVAPSEAAFLDVGCGPGVTDAMLLPHVGSLTGVDVSQGMVDTAAAANPSGTYRAYDGATLPFADDTFDASFAICVFHHIDPGAPRDRVAAEMVRVTRPGGLCVVFEHNPYNPLTRRAVSTCAFDEGVTLLTARETARHWRQARASVTDKRYILFVPVSQRVSGGADRALAKLPLGGQFYVAARP
jgi:SAM-dependent methyltransferase